MNPSDDLRARVLAAVRDDPAPTRRDRLRRALLLGVLLAVASTVVWYLANGNGLLVGDRPRAFVVGTFVGWTVVAALCGMAAFGRRRSMLGWPRAWLVAAAVGAPIVLSLWMLAWAVLYPETANTCPEPVSPFGRRCRDLAFALTAAPMAALLLARRGTVASHPAATGAAIGTAVGALAGVAINLRCGCAAPLHVLAGHVLPVAVLALVGALAGRWLLAFRGRSGE